MINTGYDPFRPIKLLVASKAELNYNILIDSEVLFLNNGLQR